MKEELRRTLAEAPTFGKVVSPKTDPPNAESDIVVDDDIAIDDFEFSFNSVESNAGFLMGAPADEIFSRGQVLPVYPVFNQNLVSGGCGTLGEEELTEGMGRLTLSNEKGDLRSGLVSSSYSTKPLEVDDVEGPQSSEAGYCIWFPRTTPVLPSPDRWEKSSSTGSETLEFRRFRLRDLVIGRSRSDGEEKLAHLPAAEKETKRYGVRPNPTHKAAPEANKRGETGKGGAVKELDVVTAHRIYYGKGSAGGRRSYLPYRQNLLVGLFGHGRRLPF